MCGRRGLGGSPGSRGCSVKCCSGSRPSAWQNCWTWLAVFSGWISTTSPAAKLWGKDSQGLGRGPPAGGGRWGSGKPQRKEAGGQGAPGRVGPTSPAVVSALGRHAPALGEERLNPGPWLPRAALTPRGPGAGPHLIPESEMSNSISRTSWKCEGPVTLRLLTMGARNGCSSEGGP